MGVKTIPLSELEADVRKTLNECADSGVAMVVELPDRRLVALQPLESSKSDDLVSDLLESNPSFQNLVANSKAAPRKPFPTGTSSPAAPPTLEELVAGITDENRHEEVRTGPAVGGEAW
jgi:hypothetical protein